MQRPHSVEPPVYATARPCSLQTAVCQAGQTLKPCMLICLSGTYMLANCSHQRADASGIGDRQRRGGAQQRHQLLIYAQLLTLHIHPMHQKLCAALRCSSKPAFYTPDTTAEAQARRSAQLPACQVHPMQQTL